jgi:hypothetical protein
MNNPIPHTGLWHTPETLEELYAMVEQFSGEQKSLAMHVMMLTLNAAHRQVELEHEDIVDFMRRG